MWSNNKKKNTSQEPCWDLVASENNTTVILLGTTATCLQFSLYFLSKWGCSVHLKILGTHLKRQRNISGELKGKELLNHTDITL